MNILKLLTPKKNVRFLKTTMAIHKVIPLLRKYRYSSVPLLDEDGYYVGTITEGDLFWFLLDQEFKDWEKLRLVDVVRNRDYDPVTINASMEELIMASLSQNFIPILDDRSFFIGIVTRKDLLTAFIAKNSEDEEKVHINPIYDALFKRRSIRRFKNQKIDQEVVNDILKVALVSPTAKNRKAHHVLFIDDEEEIKKLSEIHHKGRHFEEASNLLIILNDDLVEPNPFLANNGASAAIMSLLLAIDGSDNLGGYWVGAASSLPNKEVKEALKIPSNFSIYGFIVFGVKDEYKPANEPEASDRIHKYKW